MQTFSMLVFMVNEGEFTPTWFNSQFISHIIPDQVCRCETWTLVQIPQVDWEPSEEVVSVHSQKAYSLLIVWILCQWQTSLAFVELIRCCNQERSSKMVYEDELNHMSCGLTWTNEPPWYMDRHISHSCLMKTWKSRCRYHMCSAFQIGTGACDLMTYKIANGLDHWTIDIDTGLAITWHKTYHTCGNTMHESWRGLNKYSKCHKRGRHFL